MTLTAVHVKVNHICQETVLLEQRAKRLILTGGGGVAIISAISYNYYTKGQKSCQKQLSVVLSYSLFGITCNNFL